MAFRFRRREPVSEGFRRIVREQAASVISLLADQATSLPERIHEARRELKRLRAAVRLLQPHVAGSAAGDEEATLRAAARKLAPARDAEVALATFDALAGRLPVAVARQVRARLRAVAQAARRLSEKPLLAAASSVRKCGQALARLETDAEGWRLIGPGIADTYASARELRRAARTSPTPAALHDWRKTVKRLEFQLSLVGRALGHGKRRELRRVAKLGVQLGALNDIEVLRAAAAKALPGGLPAQFEQVLASERKRGIRRALRLAKSIFAQKPSKFAAALRRAWDRWHRAA